jgi:hypothetical protein
MFGATRKFNICIVQPDNYPHSNAFLELAELLFYSLKELGYETNLCFRGIDPNAINILIGVHLLETKFIPLLPSSTIILNTEQLHSDPMAWNQIVFEFARQFEVWDYSERNIEKFKELGIKNVKLFKIGFQRELVRLDGRKNKDIDVLFYGSFNDRRVNILDKLKNKGLNVKTLFGVYGRERDEWVERSKIVLNHHFYESQIFEIVRVFYLLTNSVAVVAEINETTSIDPMYKNGIFSSNYENLIDNCIELVNNSVVRQKLQTEAYNCIIKYPQKIFTQAMF